MGVLNLFDLRNKVALVTGGSRGIGFQMAEALGEMGAKVAVTARKQDELEVVARTSPRAIYRAWPFPTTSPISRRSRRW